MAKTSTANPKNATRARTRPTTNKKTGTARLPKPAAKKTAKTRPGKGRIRKPGSTRREGQVLVVVGMYITIFSPAEGTAVNPTAGGGLAVNGWANPPSSITGVSAWFIYDGTKYSASTTVDMTAVYPNPNWSLEIPNVPTVGIDCTLFARATATDGAGGTEAAMDCVDITIN
jgi:hypothetical protein